MNEVKAFCIVSAVSGINHRMARDKTSLKITGGLVNSPEFRKACEEFLLYRHSFTPPVRQDQDWILIVWNYSNYAPSYSSLFKGVMVFTIVGLAFLGGLWLSI